MTKLTYEYNDIEDKKPKLDPKTNNKSYMYNERITENEAKEIMVEIEDEIRDIIKDIVLRKYAIPNKNNSLTD